MISDRLVQLLSTVDVTPRGKEGETASRTIFILVLAEAVQGLLSHAENGMDFSSSPGSFRLVTKSIVHSF